MGCGSLPIGGVSFIATASTANATAGLTVKVGVASKRITITDITISTDTEMSIEQQDSASSVVSEQMYFPAKSIWSKTWSTPITLTTALGFKLVSSIAGNVSCTITGYVV